MTVCLSAILLIHGASWALSLAVRSAFTSFLALIFGPLTRVLCVLDVLERVHLQLLQF